MEPNRDIFKMEAFLLDPNAEPKTIPLHRQVNICCWIAAKEDLMSNPEKEASTAFANDGWKHILVRDGKYFLCRIFQNEKLFTEYYYTF